MDLIRTCVDIASNPKHTIWICPLLFLADAALCGLVVWKIPYTEIDWKAYMQQVSQYIAGECDYTKLYGDTGPLVYPAAHVYIYRLLHYLTNEGTDIRVAQYIFAALYLSTLALVMQCYRQAKVPPYVFPLLILSKRLHSIFMLRLFNDGFAVFFLFLAIFCYQRRLWTAGSLAYSFGLGVKMSLLLALPAVGVVLWQGMGRDRALRQAVVMGQLQVLLGYPFLAADPRSYLSRAFELSRQFLFKWTVNWRFVGEQTFLSRPFSLALLGAHAALLTAFLATRWLKPTDASPVRAIQQLINLPADEKRNKIARRITPDFILASILASIVIGCLCARSLHYQFYTYIAWSTPFLLWRSGMHPVLMYGIWAAQEWAWNVYPSINASSGVVVGVLAMTVVASWVGSGPAAERPSADSEHKHQE
ncbi:dolichyl-P-Man:Man(5)GlcNAc(2)-PP-dolichol alpha-1,3-mannosyltransferase [Friedmanniomyces endolithicus]|uniref:Dol-P-Man:Man(5)GlcNAc(2)-PP-Dol alpha-1,3-mannosyltransferase n=1 Tax=Friedmanniomyces endolithicus TaxID=329885 RepID=A0AAN6KUI3_9PEZI|nr:dolichyl-P-Man:Man(5)GlcNAc(2)-PP-dolichol alpha-1,3-mannosyltransferase [Friedmanniomyces endolithicus]KAK0807995.1 dolichyl-P-Man:Man(5)GlcNAc(2)-PP-dolichol alpha-1,3-mannosyltransferase [Friedmanniomyces endolithicus]KAK0820806.1 dolichyl-P-Man:Man(5)GlcNAc(2)-PP-dolichol alpha-1,3-mannosyltransferase [Friedmanniomyces endolithicus]KAK0855873.1 dolichyl-P-Man:Man(5)GlcNAc(2)-PP-dolichol alpha-1,3-mannosyltransferase [Friedmanniomyces endolithicus]KAK0873545.1 dolichyl-P-Man:Man(5)GlcNAc(